jgi:hypothetical protein
MPGDGSLSLSDFRGPPLGIVCEPTGGAGATTWNGSLLSVSQTLSCPISGDAHRLPQSTLGRRPRPMQGGLRGTPLRQGHNAQLLNMTRGKTVSSWITFARH